MKIAVVFKQCVACGYCVKVCPISAMSIHNGLYAVPDKSKCVGCGKCVKECPAGVIEIKNREEVSL